MQSAERIAETQTAPEISYVRDDYASGVKIPWFAKMALKVLLAKIPFSYALWVKLGVFRHGDTSKNLRNLHESYERYHNFFIQKFGHAPRNVLELGPGDSAGHALTASIYGAQKSWLVDVGEFATSDEEHYRAYFDYMREHGLIRKEAPAPASFFREDVLKFSNAEYLTNGLSDLKQVPEESVELSFSTAVLEHVRRAEFQDHMHALFRAHKSNTLSSHWVDLHDHLGGALNSMRFSKDVWETSHVQHAGFYTNRLTMGEMMECAANAGFSVELAKVIRWRSLPTARADMHADFATKSEEELNVCTFLMHLVKP